MAAETIWIRGEGGEPIEHDLPLHWTIQDQLDKGRATRVNADGTPWVETEPKPKPGARAAAKANDK